MKIELEQSDIQAIAEKVLDIVKPYLLHREDKTGEIILDVPGLCEYLKVTTKWVYEQSHLKAIPHLKIGKKQLRFKKKEIDKWIDTLQIPAFAKPTARLRVCNDKRPLP